MIDYYWLGFSCASEASNSAKHLNHLRSVSLKKEPGRLTLVKHHRFLRDKFGSGVFLAFPFVIADWKTAFAAKKFVNCPTFLLLDTYILVMYFHTLMSYSSLLWGNTKDIENVFIR